MHLLRPVVRSPCLRTPLLTPARLFHTTLSRHKSSALPFPTTPLCPPSTCTCTAMPSFPPGFEIDHSKPLPNTMPAYREQVLICTGQEDWGSRIEEENSGDNIAADIRELLGRGGRFCDPYNPITLTNSSLPSSIPSRTSVQNTSVYLFPSFKYIPFLPRYSFAAVETLVKSYLLPTKLHPAHDGLSPIHRDRLTRKREGEKLEGVRDVKDVMVLVCGHGGRDVRCGILGPILRDEFSMQLSKNGIEVLTHPVQIEDKSLPETTAEEEERVTARVATISHIGGHKFAGNIIIYIPPDATLGTGEMHPLKSMGIWYGRVEPKHVEGIVRETVLGGKVVEELFRGAINREGGVVRL